MAPADMQPGDEVRLKSGGPNMTIDNIGDYWGTTKAQCSWFVDGKRQTDTFELHSLVKVGQRHVHLRVGRA